MKRSERTSGGRSFSASGGLDPDLVLCAPDERLKCFSAILAEDLGKRLDDFLDTVLRVMAGRRAHWEDRPAGMPGRMKQVEG